ncbi:MAG: hypothetical protein HYX39_05090 [Bacteroidetes bacterium]|nr:hypothetical protein [Bacteroidota bacterium]
MKKIYLLLFSICAFASFSQAPKLINYQGVARKPSGLPFTNPVKIKFEIFDALSGGNVAFTETQSTNTNSLGLFSTQIGKTTVLSLNWDSGPWFLQVSIDTTNTGSSFIVVGRQQMVSVPYALYAQEAGSAPDPAVTFVNDVLSVGSNTVSIPSGPAYVAGSDIAISSGSIINTAPDKTVTLSPAGNAFINGSYPTFTVGAAPQTLSITSNVITLSNGGGSIVLPATSNTPNTLLTGSGAATVTTSGTNTFNVAVAPVTISGSGATNVSGTYPNFVISSPTPSAAPTPTIYGAGIATVSPTSGNNFTVNVLQPNLVGTGITTVTGTYPTYIINTPAPNTPPPAWLMQGNAGTNTLTNFIGTTDNVPFNIRVNNQKAGQIDPLLSNTFFGYWAGRDNTSGTQNTAYGINSLLKNTVGVKNLAIGTQAMENNIGGNNNTAVGTGALFSNTNGVENAATGANALYMNTKNFNTAFGSGAGYNNNGLGNVFLGYQAGYNELGSNKLYIANSNTNTPLIFGDFATGRVGLGTSAPSTGKLEISSTTTTSGLSSAIYSDLIGTGSGNYFGIYSRTDGASTGPALAVRGFAVGAGSGTKTGVEGYAIGSATGVQNTGVNAYASGSGQNYGVTSNAVGNNTTTSINYGLYSNASGGSVNWAGYFGLGNVYVQNRVGIGTTGLAATLDVAGTAQIIDNNTSTGFSAIIQNNIASGISGGALEVKNTGLRSIDNTALSVQNLATKVGGNNTTKTGLSIQSTGSWAPGTAQPNVGLYVNVSGADINNSAILMGGNVGIGTTAPTAQLEVNQFTKLGSSAPAIQMIKLTGTSAATQGGSASIVIPASIATTKILSITVMVQWNNTPGDWIQPGYTINSGYEFNWYNIGNSLYVTNKNATSANILSKPIQVLITYEQ